MRIVLQRVKSGKVTVGEEVVGSIGPGIVCYVGVNRDDTPEDAEYCLKKILGIRLWEDEATGKTWNLSVVNKGYEILLVSQFTLFAILKGNKPDFHLAMSGEDAHVFFDKFVEDAKKAYKPEKIQSK